MSGQALYESLLVLGGTAAASGDACSSCTNETFEAGSVIPGWKVGDNTAGIVTNFAYTTAPAPLAGSRSFLAKNTDSQAAYINLVIPSSVRVDIRWMMIITNTIVNEMRLFTLEDNVGGRMMQVQIDDDGLLVVHGASSSLTTANTMSPNTLYYGWATYIKGTGANGVASVAFSPDKIKETSGDYFVSVSNGTGANNITDFYLNVSDFNFGSGISGVIFDNVSISVTGEIGNFP